MNQDEYIANLPKKRMAVGVLFFNNARELLVVKPTYKENWSVPGGVCDENESPRETAIRETKEETSLNIKKVQLLCVDYMSRGKSEYSNKMENLQFIFYGGTLEDEQIDKIKLPPDELSEYKFVETEEAQKILSKNLANRLPNCIQAVKNNTAYYLEGGEIV